MFGLALGIAVGVGVGVCAAAALSYASDRYKERQQQRRYQMQREYNEYRDSRYAEVNHIYSELHYNIDNISTNYENQREILRRQAVEKLKVINRDMYESVCSLLQEELEDVDKLLTEIKSILDNINEASKKQQNTYLRTKSVNKLKSEVYETMSKLRAYKKYLMTYQKRRLDYIYNNKGEIAEMFEFSLPEEYLYNGKLISLRKGDIKEKGSLKINESMSIEYICDDISELSDFDDDADIPLLATSIRDSFDYNLSCSKGLFKSMAIYQSKIGIEAKVKRYDDKDIILDYYGLELALNKKELENPRRVPARGSKVRVYPLRYRNDLSCSPFVTERYENSTNEEEFGLIPLVLTNEKEKEFKDFIIKNNLMYAELSWKVAPFEEDNEESPYLKLQLGSEHVLKCKICINESGAEYIEFCEVLGREYLLRAEEIFIDLNMNINVFSRKNVKISKDIRENFEVFLLYIRNEFKEQRDIKNSISGLNYYNKWAEVTGKLIEYLSKGKPIKCGVLEIDEYIKRDYKTGINIIKVYIYNFEEVLDIIEERSNSMYITEYFIEDKNKKKYIVEFANDATFINIFGDYKLDDLDIIDVYPKIVPYPELMQKSALNTFREGRIANPKLKLSLLDGSQIEYSDNGERIDFFFNKSIETNESQKLAVEKAIAEDNIFLVQGPPGTGKTTVIKEIIEQHLYRYPADKILIVSQANVAVDNVIRGLLVNKNTEIDEDSIVRCGNEGSVGEDVRYVLFESKRDRYIQSIREERFDDYEKENFRKEWLRILDSKKEVSLIGECILKNHQVVGATCVGLEKKKLGLNEIIFDLVIIDEAGKALPGEILIPINRAKKLILIGDHKQLPPVVNPALYDKSKCDIDEIVEDDEKDDFLNESFFKRLFESCPETNKSILNTQFRMPNAIGTMISELFYKEENLENGSNTYDKKSIIFNNSLNLLDMSFLKEYREEKQEQSGPYNLKECEVVVKLINYIRKKEYNERIVVITPYKNQKRHLIRAVKEANLSSVDINTIDAFQGDEAEIVIYCTTRAKQKTEYFSYASRLNVALSRAKNELIIIGSSNYFRSYGEGSNLKNIDEYIKKNGQIIDYNKIN